MPLADAQQLLATVPEPPIEGEVTDFRTAIARIERNVEFFMGEHEELRKNHDIRKSWPSILPLLDALYTYNPFTSSTY
jgi:hypothetical protein